MYATDINLHCNQMPCLLINTDVFISPSGKPFCQNNRKYGQSLYMYYYLS